MGLFIFMSSIATTNPYSLAVSSLLIAVIFGLMPVAARAQTTPTVDELRAQIAALRSQIAALQAQLSTAQPRSGINSTPGRCAFLTHNMFIGATDGGTAGDVSRLQQFLADDETIYPEGFITGFFGQATLSALQRFQEQNSIASAGSPGHGFVGPMTRAALERGCGGAGLAGQLGANLKKPGNFVGNRPPQTQPQSWGGPEFPFTNAKTRPGATRAPKTAPLPVRPGTPGVSSMFNPSNFTTEITNRYLTLTPGMKLVYETKTASSTERTEILIPGETRVVKGVTTLVYRDRVWLDGALVEDTKDYLAQDRNGNVWYFGEDVNNYEDGQVADHDGSWRAGQNGAQPGIWMKANPQVGDTYAQENYPGVAEDKAEVLSISETVTVPYGTFQSCLKTYDTTPLDPDAREHKYYCPGVGAEILAVDLVSKERSELVSAEIGVTGNPPFETGPVGGSGGSGSNSGEGNGQGNGEDDDDDQAGLPSSSNLASASTSGSSLYSAVAKIILAILLPSYGR